MFGMGMAGMFDAADLVAFGVVALLLVIAPGPNTMLILTNTLTGGRAAGFATAIGVETGTLVHTLAAAIGVSTVLATSPAAFRAVKYAGAAYLVYLGVRHVMKVAAPQAGSPAAIPPRLGSAFRRALMTSVLNPKAAVFFLALPSQFVRPERGYPMLQFIVLGAIVAAIGLSVNTLVIVATSKARARLTRPFASGLPERILGGVLIALGVRLAFLP